MQDSELDKDQKSKADAIARRLSELFGTPVTVEKFGGRDHLIFPLEDEMVVRDAWDQIDPLLSFRGKLVAPFDVSLTNSKLCVSLREVLDYDQKKGERAFLNALEDTYKDEVATAAEKIKASKEKYYSDKKKMLTETIPTFNTVDKIFGQKAYRMIGADLGTRYPYALFSISDPETRLNTLDELTKIVTSAGLSMGEYRRYNSVFRDNEEGIAVLVGQIHGNPDLEKEFSSTLDKNDVRAKISNLINEAQRQSADINNTPVFENGFGDLMQGATGISKTGAHDAHKIVNANFSLPDDVKKQTLEYARALRAAMKEKGLDPINVRETAAAAGLDGNNDRVTDEALASLLIAKSMENPILGSGFGGTYVTTRFDGDLTQDEYEGKDRKDPRVVFEMARQILGDSFAKQVAGIADTQTPTGDRPYINAAETSPKSDRYR